MEFQAFQKIPRLRRGWVANQESPTLAAFKRKRDEME